MRLQIISSDRADEIERGLKRRAALPGSYNLRRADGEHWELVRDIGNKGSFTAIGGVDVLRGDVILLRGRNVWMLLAKSPGESPAP